VGIAGTFQMSSLPFFYPRSRATIPSGERAFASALQGSRSATHCNYRRRYLHGGHLPHKANNFFFATEGISSHHRGGRRARPGSIPSRNNGRIRQFAITIHRCSFVHHATKLSGYGPCWVQSPRHSTIILIVHPIVLPEKGLRTSGGS
jgi:hypothetical protein